MERYWRITAAFTPQGPYMKRGTKPTTFTLNVNAVDVHEAIAKAREWCGPFMTFDVRMFRHGEGF